MRKILLGAMVLALACGDPATEDSRGYTKAPLETAGLLIEGEPETQVNVRATLEPGLTATPPAEEEVLDAGGAAAGGEAGGGEGDAGQVSLAPGVTEEQFAQGEQLFGGVGGCMACHGPNGGGSQLAPDLTDGEWLHVDAPEVDALAGVIRDGVAEPVQYPAPMPAMGGANLSDEQVQALAGYVASIAQQ